LRMLRPPHSGQSAAERFQLRGSIPKQIANVQAVRKAAFINCKFSKFVSLA
jgi:hypothetical protein